MNIDRIENFDAVMKVEHERTLEETERTREAIRQGGTPALRGVLTARDLMQFCDNLDKKQAKKAYPFQYGQNPKCATCRGCHRVHEPPKCSENGLTCQWYKPEMRG